MTETFPEPDPAPAQTPAPAPVAFYRRTWFVSLVTGVLGFALATAIFLPGGGDDSDDDNTPAASSPAATSTTDATEPEEVEETEEPATTLTDEGDSGGLTLKLEKVTRESSITYEGGTQSSVTPDGDPITVKADEGSYYLAVSTSGVNGTKEPKDFTCGYAIDIAVFDADEAKYTPIEGLSQIKGNPGCNDQIQPGQKFKETFIFLMPETAKPNQLVFASVGYESDAAEPAGIDLSSY
jgi:hypothetical protein